MSQLLPYLFFLACPVGMGLMMRGGSPGRPAQSSQPQQPLAMTPAQQGEFAQLRAEERGSNAQR